MGKPFFPELRSDFTQIPPEPPETGETNIFYRFVDEKPPGAVFPGVEYGKLKVKDGLVDPLGLSSFQLFMTMHVEQKSQNRFTLTMISAEVDSRIDIASRTKFSKLEKFAPYYEKYKETASYGPSWRADADKFASANIMRVNGQMNHDGTMRGGHWTPLMSGIRAATMRHEADHVHFAVRGSRVVVDEFIAKAAKTGRAPDPAHSAIERIRELMVVPMGRFGFPYIDTGAKEHEKIAMRDVMFMVAWYELYELKMPVLSNAGYEALLRAQSDRLLADGMRQLGEAYPWL